MLMFSKQQKIIMVANNYSLHHPDPPESILNDALNVFLYKSHSVLTAFIRLVQNLQTCRGSIFFKYFKGVVLPRKYTSVSLPILR